MKNRFYVVKKRRISNWSVPLAIRSFLESDDYESFLRNVFSIHCDMDTICAIGGGIAEEFYHETGFEEDALLKSGYKLI